MATNISWVAAMVIAGSTLVTAGCQTAPEERPSTSSTATDTAAPRASASDGVAEGTTANPYEITGRVDRVDASTIEIAGKTIKVDSSTYVRKGGVGGSLEDVKEGDEVRASLSGGDPPKAERIEVMSGRDTER
jgi:hypothetical protein